MSKSKKKTKSNLTSIFSIVSLLIAILLIFVCAYFVKGLEDKSKVDFETSHNTTLTEAPTTTQLQTTLTPTTQVPTTPVPTTPIPTTQTTAPTVTTTNTTNSRIIVNPQQSNWNLVVVNRTREMPENYKPQLDEIFSTGYYMDYRVVPWYEKMYTAAKEDGITLTPYSGYRSYDRQKTNYNNLVQSCMSSQNLSKEEAEIVAARTILPPGTSEHNLGLAMDIINTKTDFQYSEEYKWLTENACDYGFILRYAKDKTDVTDIVYEPWHWRYVGVEYAKQIKDSGLCLEEYLTSVGIPY